MNKIIILYTKKLIYTNTKYEYNTRNNEQNYNFIYKKIIIYKYKIQI